MHIYTNANKTIKLPSVTSIISFVKIEPEFDPLIKWSNSLGFKHQRYSDVLNNAADFGTKIHETLANIVTGKPIPDEQYKGSFDDVIKYNSTISNFLKYYSQHEIETIYSEKSLLSENLGYAGTIDWVHRENNKIALVDFKTSSSYKSYMAMQLSAYMHLIEDQTGIKIDYAKIMLVSSPSFTECVFTRDQLEEHYKIFQKKFELYLMYPHDSEDDEENSLIIVND